MEQLLSFEPKELIFTFEPNKRLLTAIRLMNESGEIVAFKLLTTNPRMYRVKPRLGILSPGSDCEITVRKAALKEAPHNMRCNDKFKIQSAVVNPGATTEDARQMFNKEAGHVFHESILPVVFSKPTETSIEVSATENANSDDSEVIDPGEATDEASQNNVVQMSTKLLDIQPQELEFPCKQIAKFRTLMLTAKLNKELIRSIQLSNVTEKHVAFRVKTSCTKFIFQPNCGVVLPHSKCEITVRTPAQSNVPSDMESEKKLMIQSVIVNAAASGEDVLPDMFDRAASPIEECELRVAYSLKQEKDFSGMVELIIRGFIVVLLALASWYLMRQTLSLIGTLIMVVGMLMAKMIKKLVSDSLEDWIVKTLLYIFMHILFGRRENIRLSD